MTALTSNLILQKTRLHDLSHVKKLNVCSVQVEDISVIGNVANVEVCSLSVNHISDLSPFVDCSQLRELYLRKNRIDELHQVLYLAGAPNLRVLNLIDNPITDVRNYRSYTIAALSALESLDDIEVTPEERLAAEDKHPNIIDDIRTLGSPKRTPKTPFVSRNPSFAAPPQEPASARSAAGAPPSARGAAAQVEAAPASPAYNSDDVPVGGAARPSGLRRAQSDVGPVVQNRRAAQARPQPIRTSSSVPTQQEAAMITACTTLLNGMSPEALMAVREHLTKLGA